MDGYGLVLKVLVKEIPWDLQGKQQGLLPLAHQPHFLLPSFPGLSCCLVNQVCHLCPSRMGSFYAPGLVGINVPAPADLHVLPVLGGDEQQRPPRTRVQGLPLQQLLHGPPAAGALPQPPARGLHHHVPSALL